MAMTTRTDRKIAQVHETVTALRTAIIENRRSDAEELMKRYFLVAAQAGREPSVATH